MTSRRQWLYSWWANQLRESASPRQPRQLDFKIKSVFGNNRLYRCTARHRKNLFRIDNWPLPIRQIECLVVRLQTPNSRRRWRRRRLVRRRRYWKAQLEESQPQSLFNDRVYRQNVKSRKTHVFPVGNTRWPTAALKLLFITVDFLHLAWST